MSDKGDLREFIGQFALFGGQVMVGKNWRESALWTGG
jgi:hypothetical protein